MSELESLDARGLLCPLPVIRTQDRVKNLPPGTQLTVIATDAGTLQDIPSWCRVHGHELLDAETLEDSSGDLGAAGLEADDGTSDNNDPARSPRGRTDKLGGELVYRFRIRVAED